MGEVLSNSKVGGDGGCGCGGRMKGKRGLKKDFVFDSVSVSVSVSSAVGGCESEAGFAERLKTQMVARPSRSAK
jgi:hypothetical protein